MNLPVVEMTKEDALKAFTEKNGLQNVVEGISVTVREMTRDIDPDTAEGRKKNEQLLEQERQKLKDSEDKLREAEEAPKAEVEPEPSNIVVTLDCVQKVKKLGSQTEYFLELMRSIARANPSILNEMCAVAFAINEVVKEANLSGE